MDLLKPMSSTLTAGLFKLRFKALGTNCEIQFRTPSVEGAKSFRAAALAWIRDFEETWSRFRPTSLLSRINAAAGREAINLTPAQERIIHLCDHTHRFTGGLNDPTSLPLTRLWDAAAKADRLPTEQEITTARDLVSWSAVEWGDGTIHLPEKGMALEIGGFGKEFAVDQLIALAQKHEILDCLVDLGRDLATLGEPPHGPYWIVGVEDALLEETPAYRLALSGKAMATSGNGRRFRVIGGKKFGHIIDSRTGYPAENDLLTATCVADDCLTTGLLSTIACVLGPVEGLQEIQRHHQIDAILQCSDTTHFTQNIHRHVIAS